MINFSNVNQTLLQILGCVTIVVAIGIGFAARKKKFSYAAETVVIVLLAFFVVALGFILVTPSGQAGMVNVVKSVFNFG